MIPIKSCGFLIFRQADEPDATGSNRSLLLMRHADRWDLPKGHVDGRETNLQCALRELEEETAITPADIQIDPTFRFRNQYVVQRHRRGAEPGWKTLIIFLARLRRPVELQLTEHLGCQWWDWQPQLQIQPQTIDPLLRQLDRHWQGRD